MGWFDGWFPKSSWEHNDDESLDLCKRIYEKYGPGVVDTGGVDHGVWIRYQDGPRKRIYVFVCFCHYGHHLFEQVKVVHEPLQAADNEGGWRNCGDLQYMNRYMRWGEGMKYEDPHQPNKTLAFLDSKYGIFAMQRAYVAKNEQAKKDKIDKQNKRLQDAF